MATMPPSDRSRPPRRLPLLVGIGVLAVAVVAVVWLIWPLDGDASGARPVVHPDPARAQRIASADPAAGERLTQQLCRACHTFNRSGMLRVGPNLWDIVGAPKARVEGFGYSAALTRAGGVWSEGELDRFLSDPHGVMPGNSMSFEGLRNAEQRADLIGYLRTLHD